jgi:hypothetical protein
VRRLGDIGSKVRSVRRRLVVFLLVCLAVPAVALAADGEPKKKIVAADQRKAASLVLKRSDFLAGFKRTTTSDSGEDLDCAGYNPDQSDLTLTGEAETTFTHTGGFPSVYTFSNVFVSSKDALASWTRSVKPALARCLGEAFREAAAGDGASVKLVSAGRMAFPKLAPRTAAFKVVLRVTVTEKGETATVPFTIHVLALGHGRGDVGLMAMHPGVGLASADLREFGQLLASRLAAAKL